MLQVRNEDFARYQDLERKRADHLENEVDELHSQLVKMDKRLKLALCKVDAVRKADTVSKELSKAQMQLAKSTLALMAKQKKTKFVTAHTVSYTSTKPRKEIK